MPKPEKAYPVRLVGTRSYAQAVGQAFVGDPVQLLQEAGNPYDSDAIAVADAANRTLGYVPRDSWVRRALIDEGRGCLAEVSQCDQGALTISVILNNDGAIGTRDYAPPE